MLENTFYYGSGGRWQNVEEVYSLCGVSLCLGILSDKDGAVQCISGKTYTSQAQTVRK